MTIIPAPVRTGDTTPPGATLVPNSAKADGGGGTAADYVAESTLIPNPANPSGGGGTKAPFIPGSTPIPA